MSNSLANFIKNFFEKERQISLFDFFIIFLGFTLFRGFLENFSNPETNGFFTSPYSVFFEYFLFYVSTFLILLISLSYLTKIHARKLANIAIFFFPIICIPPIIDLLITHGNGSCMMYIISKPKDLLLNFATFFGHFSDCGITTGIKTEVFIICIGIFTFVYSLTKNVIRSLLGAFFGYLSIFFTLSLPSLIMLPFYFLDKSLNETFFFGKLFKSSLLNSIHTFGSLPADPQILFEQQSAIFMARSLWILITVSLSILFYVNYRTVWSAWIRNLRPERILYYFFIAIFGMSVSQKINGLLPAFTLPDIFAFIMFFALIALSFWLAVVINDIEDVGIDAISNSDRPLITKTISLSQFKTIGFVILILILTGSPLLNYPVFIFLILFQLVYYFYSKKPLYLKRHFLIASPLLALNALLIAMAGFFLVSADQRFLAFPSEITWLILIGFSIITNVKDIKDYAGDKAHNIKTLPVIFGLNKTKKIMTVLGIAFMFALAIYKQSDYLIITSIAFSFLLYIFLNKIKYREIYLFCIFFLYMLTAMLA